MAERRLNKYLADSGFCSRREADRLIAEGRVSLDGRIAALGERVPEGAKVSVDGVEIRESGAKAYLAVYKPVGIVCTADPREPMNIVDYINYPERIYPVGRLDKDSEGLILMTSDGDIVNRILRAGGRHEKEYEVALNRKVDEAFLESLRTGVPVLGRMTLPARVSRTGPGSFRMVLVQGMNRQIRRMCEYLGAGVVHLRRVRIMNIRLAGMQPGHWRHLTEKELSALRASLDRAGDAAEEDEQ